MATQRRLPPDSYDIVEMIRRELAPMASALQQLTNDHATKTDVQQLRDELQQTRRETYSREVMDGKLGHLAENIDTLSTALHDARKGTLDEREKMWLRGGIIVSVAWTLIQLVPHLANVFK